MNVGQLKELVNRLLETEDDWNVLKDISALESALSGLVNNPASGDDQKAVRFALDALDGTLQGIQSVFTGADVERMRELGLEDFVGRGMVDDIEQALRDNAAMPAAAQEVVARFKSTREQSLERLSALSGGLELSKSSDEFNTPGSAEIGFKIPRSLFHNDLQGLIRELGAIRQIIRAFAELKTRTVGPIEVHQISTTDPLFFFGIDPVVVAEIGLAITWALGVWKALEEIKEIRRRSAQSKAWTPEAIDGFFGKTIKDTVEKAVQEKVDQLLPQDGKAGRAAEQRNALSGALESILARVERGMTVEVKLIPPAPVEVPEGRPQPKHKNAAAFEAIKAVAPQLVFPPPEEIPVTRLPSAPKGDSAPTKRTKARAKRRPPAAQTPPTDEKGSA